MVQELIAKPDGHGLRVAIAVARFNEMVTERLLQGAQETLLAAGVADADITVARVPGALELPQACSWLSQSGKFAAIVALGAVIRGGTDHYDHVCRAAIEGILQVNLSTAVPVSCGVLTCGEQDLAMARAGGPAGNKGNDAALAVLEMAGLAKQLRPDQP